MATRDESLATIESLGVAPVFANSYRSKDLPFHLEIYFGPPEEFFLGPETQDIYTEGRLIPLLDDGNFGIVTFYDPTAHTFVQIDIEEPDGERTILRSWQQYLADLFIRIADSGVEDAAGLAQISNMIGFMHLERTLEFMESAKDHGWCATIAEFISSL